MALFPSMVKLHSETLRPQRPRDRADPPQRVIRLFRLMRSKTRGQFRYADQALSCAWHQWHFAAHVKNLKLGRYSGTRVKRANPESR